MFTNKQTKWKTFLFFFIFAFIAKNKCWNEDFVAIKRFFFSSFYSRLFPPIFPNIFIAFCLDLSLYILIIIIIFLKS